mmetsp:Transcript_7582/g.15242  ORF Transcript_7582/g.15242 Transcript_7582/m.15242 type:complete len:1299 (-) Transcript_7582:1091-4987(-)
MVFSESVSAAPFPFLHGDNENNNRVNNNSGATTATNTSQTNDNVGKKNDDLVANDVNMAEAGAGDGAGAGADAEGGASASSASTAAASAAPEGGEAASNKPEAEAAGAGEEDGDDGDVEMKDAAEGGEEAAASAPSEEAAASSAENEKDEADAPAAAEDDGSSNGVAAVAAAGDGDGGAAGEEDEKSEKDDVGTGSGQAAAAPAPEGDKVDPTDEVEAIAGPAQPNQNGGDDGAAGEAATTPDRMDIDEGTGDGNKKDEAASGGGTSDVAAASAAAVPAPSANGDAKDTATPKDAAAADGGDNKNGEAGAAAPPPPPLLKGTLSYNLEQRKHKLQGMWNYENSNAFPAQRFELVRNLGPEENPAELPKDGEFHGSFSLAYVHVTSKGKRKERSKVIPESGVKIKFVKKDSFGKEYDVDGMGTNQFGVFSIVGKATKSEHEGDPEYHVELRKKYVQTTEPVAVPATPAKTGGKKQNKKRDGEANGDDASSAGPLPPPSESFPANVVCLRGKLEKVAGDGLLGENTVHRVSGLWSSGLNLIEGDPDNSKGMCNKFEYEHRAMVGTDAFPISGKYAGWFYVTGEDGQRTQIMERDVTLKFRKNSEGYYNIEGRGANVFGKYSITGTLSKDSVLTIFRHFKPIKIKTKPPTAAPGPLKAATAIKSAKPAEPDGPPPLTLDEVEIPNGDKPETELEPVTPPDHGTYSAISRGVLKINQFDGAHTCSGKWAATREHYSNGQTSNFHFGLEAFNAQEDAEAMKKLSGDNRDGAKDEDAKDSGTPKAISPVPPANLGTTTFPIDSAHYKGSFKLRRGARNQNIVDKQIVLKFRKNKQGSYNVHGVGINQIGKFNLVGILINSGRGSGHVELYRMYPITQAAVRAPPAKSPSKSKTALDGIAPSGIPKPTSGSLIRRESSRAVKLPTRLDEDDPEHQRLRIMEKCKEILKFLRDKDRIAGSIFAEPVDPVALNLPTYHQIITNPMDLGTIQTKMDSGEVSSCDEFARLVRLAFENAMKFNVDPTNVVHIAAKNMLTMFNQKYRDVELMDKKRQPTKAEIKEAKRLEKEAEKAAKEAKRKEKKRKKSGEEPSEHKRPKMTAAAAMAAANESAMQALLSAVPLDHGSVTRNEFNLLIQMVKQMQQQMVQMQTMISSGAGGTAAAAASGLSSPSVPPAMPTPAAASTTAFEPVAKKQKRSKSKKSKNAPLPVLVEEPLTFEEQEELTEAINNISPDMLTGIIQIIRESTTVGDDEDEIDLEIDALDTTTQRKLQRYVMKVRYSCSLLRTDAHIAVVLLYLIPIFFCYLVF